MQWKILTSPSDLMIKVHVPMNLRMTKPPNTVLISGIPLCFAYKAYSVTRILAVTANITYKFISLWKYGTKTEHILKLR